MNKILTISEWEIMRVIWTLGEATSNQIIHIMYSKKKWQPSTVKTLLNRILQKGFLKTNGARRNRLYSPTIREHDAMSQTLQTTINSMCSMAVGSALIDLFDDIPLSHSDIVKLQTLLTQKIKNAPETINCDCLPGDCEDCK